MFSCNSNSSYKTEYELKQELKELERENPVDKVSAKYSNWKNLVGEMVVEGDCFSSSDLTTFKDVQIRVNFLSNTNTHLGSEKFVIYEYLKPRSSVHFKQKFMVPREVKNVSLEIIDASNI
mgnify:FL=1